MGAGAVAGGSSHPQREDGEREEGMWRPRRSPSRSGRAEEQRAHGTIGAAEFVSIVMPAGGGRLALSVSKTMTAAAGIAVGYSAEFSIRAVGRRGIRIGSPRGLVAGDNAAS
jgi:hypothetical protein